MPNNDIFLEMKGIVKTFPGVLSLNNVDFTVRSGKTIALVGENGAGKSTLMKILSGVHKMDKGEIFISGKKADITNTLDSLALGISIIYQELNLLPNMNIAENIYIGREPKKYGLADKAAMHKGSKALLEEVGLNVDTRMLVGNLSTAQKQMVEVAKALSFNIKLIVMDEPTSSLTEKETGTLFEIIKKLKEKNVAVIFISHRMNEIFEISDEIAVMRDGEMVGHLQKEKCSEDEVINLMVGRTITDIFAKDKAEIGEEVLRVENICTEGLLKDISFTLKKGEILGFAGLIGSGRSEVMRAIFGIDKKESGSIYISGKKVEIKSTVDSIKNKIGFVPEDRKEQGLILSASVKRNISLAALNIISVIKLFFMRMFINKKEEERLSNEYIKQLRIKTPSGEQAVVNLSGGNQQKVVIAKWMVTKPDILILDEPTRGIDIGAKKEIHSLMSALVKTGVAIIMISSELPEVLGMSDRIIVMHEGQIKGELSRKEASQEAILKMAIS